MTIQISKIGTVATLSLLILCSSLNAYAAPGTLPTIPLHNSNTGVKPNIFITTDDSGSMSYEFIYKTISPLFPAASEGVPRIGGMATYSMIPGWYSTYAPTVSSNSNAWVFYNHNANKLYYNPDIDYDPWPGHDAAGNFLYQDADITAVRKNPNSTASVYNINNLQYSRYLPFYCSWDSDPNNNGIDETDPHTCIEIHATRGPATYPSGRTFAEEIQNFANWMQYYRNRDLAAKNALGVLVNSTENARMGIRYINAGHKLNLLPMDVALNKSNLLNEIYTTMPSGGTPLRAALKATGDMFTQSGAIVSAAEGGECQQNFNILMTDGFWNQYFNPSDINNDDGDNNTQFDGTASQSIDGGNYADDTYKTLADVAMHYYENDLRSDLADLVPISTGTDLAPHQHLVNYTVAFGLTGQLRADTDLLSASFQWPVAASNTLTTLDDLWHAAFNSRGLYLSADNPQNLLDSLLSSILNITERTTIASAAAVTSAELTTDSIVYLAEYNSVNWSGTILAKRIRTDAQGNVLATGELESQPAWDASVLLDARDSASRTIISFNRATNNGIPFKWDLNNDPLTDAMKDDLRTNCSTSTTTVVTPPAGNCINYLSKIYCPVSRTDYQACSRSDRLKLSGRRYCYDPTVNTTTTTTSTANCTVDPDVTAMSRVAFLRGDRSNEGTGDDFRQRASVLGDIVNSGPVFVNAPSLNYPDIAPFTGYSTFKDNNSSRTGVVYAGSNDGMFHAFNAETGREMLAYIPSYLFSTAEKSGLHYLTDKRYTHAFYNDLQSTVADVNVNGWKTVLVGGARAGGRGYFAMDVTNPGAFNDTDAVNVPMWEFSSADDPDLGYTYSRPQIGVLNDGTWVAIFGNGYNSTNDGKAKLFIVKLAGDVDGDGWTEGVDYVKISTNGSGTVADPNGLATPALADIDGNGTIDRAYAGDLTGKLWAFDLSGDFGSALQLAYTAPLFVTEGQEPITTKPILSFHPTQPSGNNAPNLMVFFGSGQFLVSSDPADTSLNYFYGVWDKGQPTATLTSNNLVEQTWSHSAGSIPTSLPVDYAGGDYGWYIALQDSGERSVTNPAVRGNAVIFNTTVPTTSPCSSDGSGWRYAVDLTTGGITTEPVLDLNNDGVVDSSDMISTTRNLVPTSRITKIPTDNTFTETVGYTGDAPFSIVELQKPNIGRFSWQELLK